MIDRPSDDRSPSPAPKDIATELQLFTSSEGIEETCTAIISSMPEEVAAFRNGHEKVINKMIGAIMRDSKRKLDAGTLKEVLTRMILESASEGKSEGDEMVTGESQTVDSQMVERQTVEPSQVP